MTTSKQPAYLIQGKNIIIVMDGKSHTVSQSTHISYSKIIDALKAKDWEELRNLVEPVKAIIDFGAGNVAIVNGVVSWKGRPFHNSLSTRMIEMYSEGFPVDPMVRFMENLMLNPSKRSVDQLYGFLDKNSLPITEDGCFLAFKKVTKKHMDLHTGTISNKIGEIVEMDRNVVDDNPDSYCSSGLHFCSIGYLSGFGGSDDPVMILKINPADVVSIPADANGAKGRCCRYEVVAQVNGDPKDAFESVVNSTYSPKATTTLDSSSVWPFPVRAAMAESVDKSPYVDEEKFDDCIWPQVKPTSATQLYDLRRQRGNNLEYFGLTLTEARLRADKNLLQKKAVLIVVKTGTNIQV